MFRHVTGNVAITLTRAVNIYVSSSNEVFSYGLGFASIRWIQALRRRHHSEIQVVILRILVTDSKFLRDFHQFTSVFTFFMKPLIIDD